MNRSVATLSAVALAASLLAATVPSADAKPTGLTTTDTAFLKSNEQVNLAEITLAGIVLAGTSDKRADRLATVTMADHVAAMAANEKVAAAEGITLPDAPSAMQRATATALAATSPAAMAMTYYTDQVAGHQASIAETRIELARGNATLVRNYAKYYLPIAAMHLKMSTHDAKRVS